MKTRAQILKEVKERMSTGNYAEIHKLKSIKSVDRLVILGEKILTNSEIYDYYQKVVDIQANDDLQLKAIGYLMDMDLYFKLSDVGKQKYVLDLSCFYLNLKDEYYKSLEKNT